MKSLRLFILVLMAVLLPVRGAVAAAMVCPGGAVPPAASAATGQGHHDMHADTGEHAMDPSSHHVADEGVAGSDDAPCGEHTGTCPFCASGCSVTPLTSAPPSIASPLPIAAVTFPALSAPVPAFQSDGPERPPRTR